MAGPGCREPVELFVGDVLHLVPVHLLPDQARPEPLRGGLQRVLGRQAPEEVEE